MPELPEVQTLVDNLNALKLLGCGITRADVYWPKTIAEMTPAIFCRDITGCIIQQISRRGKYIVMTLSRGLTLLIHLRMTGRLNWVSPEVTRHRHEHVILALDNQMDLRFQDTRKFGRMTLTLHPETILGKLGLEPLADSFTFDQLRRILLGCRRQIKPLLLDQGKIAGLGNIYVDEALWLSRIHPLRISSTLKKREIGALHKAIPRVLRTGLDNLGTTLGSGEGNFYSVAGRQGRNADALNVFRRTGQTCPDCHTPIQRILVGQRSSHVCPACQKSP